jgi:hypothetical protein
VLPKWAFRKSGLNSVDFSKAGRKLLYAIFMQSLCSLDVVLMQSWCIQVNGMEKQTDYVARRDLFYPNHLCDKDVEI